MCFSPGWTLHVQFGGASYVYQLYFHFANLLDDLDFISLSLLDGCGPGRSKSTYETVLSLIQSFSGQRCGNNPFMLSRNDNDSKIRLPPSPPPPLRSICFYPNQHSSPAHPPASYPPPCLCRLRKWSQIVVIISSICNTYIMFRRWIKRNMGIS